MWKLLLNVCCFSCSKCNELGNGNKLQAVKDRVLCSNVHDDHYHVGLTWRLLVLKVLLFLVWRQKATWQRTLVLLIFLYWFTSTVTWRQLFLLFCISGSKIELNFWVFAFTSDIYIAYNSWNYQQFQDFYKNSLLFFF